MVFVSDSETAFRCFENRRFLRIGFCFVMIVFFRVFFCLICLLVCLYGVITRS